MRARYDMLFHLSHLRGRGKQVTDIVMNDAGPPTIFSEERRRAAWRRLVSRSRRANAARYLLDDAIDDVIERASFMKLRPEDAFVIGDWTGRLQDHLTSAGTSVTTAELDRFDEQRPFGESRYDMLIHLLHLGTINDLPGALVHMHRALGPGGVLFAAFPAAGSLSRLREWMVKADGPSPAARMHPLVDRQAAAGLLQRAGFRRQVVDSHTITVRYSSFQRLLDDLRDQGLTNVLNDPGRSLGRKDRAEAEAAFDTARDRDGKVVERFEMMTLTGWK